MNVEGKPYLTKLSVGNCNVQSVTNHLVYFKSNSDQIPNFLPGKLLVFLPEILVQRLDK